MSKSIYAGVTLAVVAFFMIVLSTITMAQHNSYATQERAEQQSILALSEWVGVTTKNAVPARDAVSIVKTVYRTAKRHNVDPLLILAMTRHESGFRTKAKSHAGAKGLMQVIPYWHKDKIRGRNIFDTAVNIEVGTKIIDDCLYKHKDNVKRALNCYSGGAGIEYYQRIASSHKQMRQHIVAHAILNDRPVMDTVAFGKPRLFTPDEPAGNHFAHKPGAKDPADT